MRPWTRITTDTHITEQLQDNMEPLMKTVEDSALLKGTLLEKIELDGDTSVPHGLERSPTGWLVVRKRAPAVITDLKGNDSNPLQTNVNDNATVNITSGNGNLLAAVNHGDLVSVNAGEDYVAVVAVATDDQMTVSKPIGDGGATQQFMVKRAPAIISDTQDDNPNPEKSLALVSSAPVTVDLWVF